MLTLPDLARDSKVSKWTWARLIKAGKLPSVLIGRRRRVLESDYRRFIRQGRGK